MEYEKNRPGATTEPMPGTAAAYRPIASGPGPKSSNRSHWMPLEWSSSRRTVTAGSAPASSGSTSTAGVSRPMPCSSQSSSSVVAVNTFDTDATWFTVSTVIASPVATLRTPWATTVRSPSTDTPSTAPGTRARSHASASRERSSSGSGRRGSGAGVGGGVGTRP